MQMVRETRTMAYETRTMAWDTNYGVACPGSCLTNQIGIFRHGSRFHSVTSRTLAKIYLVER